MRKTEKPHIDHYKLDKENSQFKEVLLQEIRIVYTTTTMNDICQNPLLLTFNIDDKSISFRVIDQNRKPHFKSL